MVGNFNAQYHVGTFSSALALMLMFEGMMPFP